MVPTFARPTSEEIDGVIIDAAAALFSRRGFEATSVQSIADAVGYSKAGLLHRVGSKETLHVAVFDSWTAVVTSALAAPRELPPGAERDRAVLTALGEVMIGRPGFLTLMLNCLLVDPGDGEPGHNDIGRMIASAFDIHLEPAGDKTPTDRIAGVIGAVGALSVTILALRDQVLADRLLRLAVATSCAALGGATSTVER